MPCNCDQTGGDGGDSGQEGRRRLFVDHLEAELNRLRDELRDLKRCQLQYASLSILGTGGIIGFAATLATNGDGPPYLGVALLAPLVIVVPCWWIFFDKATTITRIVGYVRLVERQLEEAIGIRDRFEGPFPGYESALADFRENEKELREGNPVSVGSHEEPERAGFPWRHQYWTVHWAMFCLISLLCVLLAAVVGEDGFPRPYAFYASMIVSGTILIASTMLTFRLLRDLRHGRASYERMAALWNALPGLLKTKARDGNPEADGDGAA